MRKRIVEELSGAFACARGFLSSILDLFAQEPRRAGLTLALLAGALLWLCARVSRDLLHSRRGLRAKRLELV